MENYQRPSFRQLSWNSRFSFNAKIDSGNNLSSVWHYHPEMELILVRGSVGRRIVGTSVESFSDNDMVLIGKNVPHAFIHEENHMPAEGNPRPEALVIQFYETFLGKEFLGLPELKEIQRLFIKARQGLHITDQAKKKIIPLAEKIISASSLDRILLLLEIFRVLINEDAYETLINETLAYQLNSEGDSRINKILNYTTANFDRNIKIDQVASTVNLTKESFCRYFKAHANKTYFEFLTEFRIHKACRMILEDSQSIKEIGYSCGFDSLSNFYYQFKKNTRKSPLEFRNMKMAEIQE